MRGKINLGLKNQKRGENRGKRLPQKNDPWGQKASHVAVCGRKVVGAKEKRETGLPHGKDRIANSGGGKE